MEAVQTVVNQMAKQLQGLQLDGIRRCDFDCHFMTATSDSGLQLHARGTQKTCRGGSKISKHA